MKDFDKSNSLLLDEIQTLQFELASSKLTAVKRTSELYKSEERFSLAMRGANDGLWDWCLESGDVYYSPRWKNMLGYDADQLDDTIETWVSMVHPDDKDWVLGKVQDYIEDRVQCFEVEMRMRHKDGHEIYVLSRAFLVNRKSDNKPVRLVGTHVNITERKREEKFDEIHTDILEMIARGYPAVSIYDAIALMYEERHPGMRCSILELHGNILLHGGAPSLPKAYCDAVHGLKFGPDVGSCGASTYSEERVIVENIETDSKWANLKHLALPHGMRCCWSEPIKNSYGDILGAFGMYYDHPALPDDEELHDLKSAGRLAGIVMERDHNQKRIRELAFTDELTELANRRHFYQHLESLIQSSVGRKSRFTLLYLDLDNFKAVNDSHGHDAGDSLLQIIAKCLKETCHDTDFVARLSGDEFCILIENGNNKYAAKLAQRCLEAVSLPVELFGRKHTPACSIGIASFPEDGDSLTSIINLADISLYAAKENGKNQYVFYDPELTRMAEYRFQVEQFLRSAIKNNELSLVYQPQVDTTTGKIFGVEALARWKHPLLGQISPIEFIATAEKIGMIKPLTEWVLNKACRQAVAWQQAGLPAIQMAVNISPLHFLDKEIVSLIKRTLYETGIDPTKLELEVTEGAIQTDQRNLSIFKDLKAQGIQLAIDDFGTGYSSFASLKHLTVDCLKIDKYFVDDLIGDKDAQTLVASMIDIGQKLSHTIIAEGIESKEQLAIIKGMGCEMMQGYFFSKPVDAESISALMIGQSIH